MKLCTQKGYIDDISVHSVLKKLVMLIKSFHEDMQAGISVGDNLLR